MLRYNVDERITLKDVIERQKNVTKPRIDQVLLRAREMIILLLFLVVSSLEILIKRNPYNIKIDHLVRLL
jgi:hypothetical protein